MNHIIRTKETKEWIKIVDKGGYWLLNIEDDLWFIDPEELNLCIYSQYFGINL